MQQNTNSIVFPLILLTFGKGKFERLITKTNLDQRSSMILASKLLFLSDFDPKLDEYSSTMTLPRQH